jgi:hypothetical protein
LATFKIADFYAQFSKALLTSQRPQGLSGDELEQYELPLEEQVIPFEEKAIEYHALNTRFVTQGGYDQWVKKSYAVLAKLVPAKYDRVERLEDYVEIPLSQVGWVAPTNNAWPYNGGGQMPTYDTTPHL